MKWYFTKAHPVQRGNLQTRPETKFGNLSQKYTLIFLTEHMDIPENCQFSCTFNSFIPKANHFSAISWRACINKQMTSLMLNKARKKDTNFVTVPVLCAPLRFNGENPQRDVSAGVKLHYNHFRYIKFSLMVRPRRHKQKMY